METDYESFPTQPRKRQTSTYGKKGRNRSNLSSRLLSNPTLPSFDSSQQQENKHSSTGRRALKRATSEVQLGKRRRSKEEELEGSQSDGDASMESNDEESTKGVQLPQTKRPRASSHDTTILSVSQPSVVISASSAANTHSITSKSSHLGLDKASNSSSTSKYQLTSNSKLTPLDKLSSNLGRRTKSRSIDDGRGIENPTGLISIGMKAKEREGEEVEKEQDLQTMMQYVMMDDEEAPATSASLQSESQIQQSSRPRAALLASITFPPSSPTTSVLGDKSNLPRSAQDAPIATTNQQVASSRAITSGLIAEERKSSKKSNLKIALPSPKPSLKVYKDESATPRATSFSNRQSNVNIRRATSLNTESGQALNLDSLSNALFSESGRLEVPNHSASRSYLNDAIRPNIIRHSSVPLPTPSTKHISQFTNQHKDHLTIADNVARTETIDPEPREGSLIPIDAIGMDSSMIIESFDPDDDEDDQDKEVKIDLVFSGGDLRLKEDVQKVGDGIQVAEMVEELRNREEENFPVLGNEAEEDDRDVMEIDHNSVNSMAIEERRDSMEEEIKDVVGSGEAEEVSTHIDAHEFQTIPSIDSIFSNQSLKASKIVTFQESQILPRSPGEDSSEDDSRSYYTSSEIEEFSFTLPPRTLSQPIDPPTTSGRPLIDEDYLAYFIRTTSTGENEFDDDGDEFDEMEIGEGSKPGSRIDSDGVSSRGREKIRKERERVEAKRLKNQILVNPLESGETDDELMIRVDKC